MSLKTLLENSKEEINRFFSRFNREPLEELISFLKEREGLIFLSGVGKSGFIAEKVAATLTSTGTRAFYLSAQGSLHGDIGWVQKGDVVLLFSKSGESEELLAMIPFLRNRGAHLVAFCSNKNSHLVQACHRFIEIPFERELGEIDMVPTLSTTFLQIIGDVMAVALMEGKAISSAEFAKNHPAGRIGKRLTMTIQDLMMQGEDLPVAHQDAKLMDALVDFTNKRAGCLLVTDSAGRLKGIFTDGDLRRALQKWGAAVMEMSLVSLMSRDPRAVSKELLLYDALQLMEKDQSRPVTVLPVVGADQKVIGLIKLHDILQAGI